MRKIQRGILKSLERQERAELIAKLNTPLRI